MAAGRRHCPGLAPALSARLDAVSALHIPQRRTAGANKEWVDGANSPGRRRRRRRRGAAHGTALARCRRRLPARPGRAAPRPRLRHCDGAGHALVCAAAWCRPVGTHAQQLCRVARPPAFPPAAPCGRRIPTCTRPCCRPRLAARWAGGPPGTAPSTWPATSTATTQFPARTMSELACVHRRRRALCGAAMRARRAAAHRRPELLTGASDPPHLEPRRLPPAGTTPPAARPTPTSPKTPTSREAAGATHPGCAGQQRPRCSALGCRAGAGARRGRAVPQRAVGQRWQRRRPHRMPATPRLARAAPRSPARSYVIPAPTQAYWGFPTNWYPSPQAPTWEVRTGGTRGRPGCARQAAARPAGGAAATVDTRASCCRAVARAGQAAAELPLPPHAPLPALQELGHNQAGVVVSATETIHSSVKVQTIDPLGARRQPARLAGMGGKGGRPRKAVQGLAMPCQQQHLPAACPGAPRRLPCLHALPACLLVARRPPATTACRRRASPPAQQFARSSCSESLSRDRVGPHVHPCPAPLRRSGGRHRRERHPLGAAAAPRGHHRAAHRPGEGWPRPAGVVAAASSRPHWGGEGPSKPLVLRPATHCGR